MSVQSAQLVTATFSTRNAATGVGTIADSLPTGVLYVNGVANAATVTVTNISGGLYRAAVTLPTLAIGDIVEIQITATVATITDTAKIWGDTKDFLADASGFVTANMNGDFTATQKTSITTAATAATPTAAAVTGAVGSVTGAVGSVTGAVGSVTGNVGGNVVGSVGSVTGLTASNLDTTVSSRLAAASYTTPPTANANADALLDRSNGIETGYTFRQVMRLMGAVLLGKNTAAATSDTFRDINDTKNRVTATDDTSGNRTVITLDAS